MGSFILAPHDQNWADRDVERRRGDVSTRLQGHGDPRVICIPAPASENGREDFFKTWPNCYVVHANGRSGTDPGSFVACIDQDGKETPLAERSSEENVVVTSPI
jgi:hypothetical protein